MLGDGLGGNCSIKQSGKKRISLGAGEKRGSKRRLLSVLQEWLVFTAH